MASGIVMNNERDILEVGDLFAFWESQPEIYEILSQSEDFDKRILRTMLADVSFENRIVLDLGAGTGKFSVPLSSKAKLVVSLDKSEGALDILLGKSRRKRIAVLKGVFSNIPLSDGSVDIILATWAFNPSLPNAESIFGEMLRVAKKGGKIIIVGNYPAGEYHLIKKRFLLEPGTECKYFNKWLLTKGCKRKIMDVKVDLRSKSNIEKVLSGQPPLEMIKQYLAQRNKTWFSLRVSVFYYKKP
jgi:ubiquinone/menaquinone biosynthesis C-methylase UbiE